MQASTAPVTFLFTDIEGSTRLWESAPEQMRAALARHDALGEAAITGHHGRIVKTTGDGIHAVFDDPLDAIAASLAFSRPSPMRRRPPASRCAFAAGCTSASTSAAFPSAAPST